MKPSNLVPDIINENLFMKDASAPHLWKESWEYMHQHGVLVYGPSDMVPFTRFPPIAARHHLGRGTVISPKPEWNSVLIPFSPEKHDEHLFNGRLISDVMKPLIQGQDDKKKYIASARSWYRFFAEMDVVEYSIFENLVGTNEIIPFLLFDETLSYCFGFDFDFEYAFFSSATLAQDDARLNGALSEWDAYFVDYFVKKAPKNTRHIELFEKILAPSIPRIFDVS